MRNGRIYITVLIFFVILTGLVSRIFELQIIKGEKLARQAAAMRARQVELNEYPRGDILDRNLLPLTGVSASNALYGLPGVLGQGSEHSREQFERTAQFLARVLPDLNPNEIYARLTSAAAQNTPFVRIKSGLTSSQISKINAAQISGLVVAPITKRYASPGLGAHVLGYVSPAGRNEGQAGLEKMYNDILSQHQSSQQLVSVLDARGMAIQGLMFRLKSQQADNGRVVLTIDKRVQKIAEAAMDKRVKKGAVVILKVKSREVMAMASRPNFDPYQVDKLIDQDEQSSLLNRALNPYFPGSLFKILITAAALEEKAVTPAEKFTCSGKYVFNDQVSISCWKEEGHGRLTFSEALAKSCNPTFIAAAQRLGREKVMQYVRSFHLADESLAGYKMGKCGSYVQIEAGEAALGNACLGQEGVMLTPLQLASLLATVADDGRWVEPSLVRYSVDQDGQRHYPPRQPSEQAISVATAREVQRLLELVVSSGTGKTAALQEVPVAGKTATSETGALKEEQEQVLNTWFGGYFPADRPEWVIVVLSEDGISGAQNAAPVFQDIARGILQCYSK